MARKDRQFNVFALSFLDVMAGGFGAVVIIFLIINHATETDLESDNRELLSESRLLDYQEETGLDNLAKLREVIGNLTTRLADTKRMMETVLDDLEITEEQVEQTEKVSLEQSDTLEQLIQELQTRDSEVKSLRRQSQRTSGQTTISIAGEGDRQYLTGLYMGGTHIMLALDASASMLDINIVNILRRRNMSRERQLNSPKWQRAIRTVEWLSANIPISSKFQVILFNKEATYLVKGGQWIDASDGEATRKLMEDLNNSIPEDGSNLYRLFEKVGEITPLPDSLFLIVDGFPTQGQRETSRTRVTGRERQALFQSAVNKLPYGIPVNVILFPLEGEPSAPVLYWNLAHITGGSLLAPASDWP